MAIETTLKYIEQKQDKQEETNNKQHEQIINKLNEFIDTAPSKFAEKKVEDRIKVLEDKDKKNDIFIAKIVGGAMVAFFLVNMALKYFNLI